MRNLTILGGPQDGRIVPWAGSVMYLPVPPVRHIILATDDEPIPMMNEYQTDCYDAKMDFDGRWWYVRRT